MTLRALLLLAWLAVPAAAKDLGVQGTVWPVAERDMRELLMESAARADWGSAQKELEQSARAYAGTLPRRDLPVADRTSTRWIDPSVVVESDIRIPVRQASGEYAWEVLYKAGSRVNPLSHAVPRTAMLFFSGSNAEQVALATRLWAAAGGRVMPVDVSGTNVEKLSRSAGFPVYYAHDALLQRFDVKEAPALLYPGSGEHRLHLGLTSLAAPFRDQEAMDAIAHLLPFAAERSRK